MRLRRGGPPARHTGSCRARAHAGGARAARPRRAGPLVRWPVRTGAPPAGDHRPVAQGRAADGRRAARAHGRLQRLPLQLQGAARGARARRAYLRLDLGHRGDPQGLGGVARGDARPLQGHVRLRPVGGGDGAHDPRPGPARDQAAVCGGRARRRDPVRLHAAGARGRRRHRRRGRPGRAAPLPELALGCAGPAHDPARGPQARARDAAGRRARRAAARAPLVGPAVHARPQPLGLDAGGLGGGHARRPADRRRAAHGGRRPRRGAALRRAGLLPDRRAARRVGPARPRHLLDRLPRRGRPRGRRVPLLRPDRARVRDGSPADPRRRRPADRGAAAGDRGHERADDLPRRGGLLPAQRGGRARPQGRPVRPGRRRGAGRLLLVPADAGGAGRRARHLRVGVLRPRRRSRGRARRPRRSTATRAATSPPTGSAAPEPRARSTGRCGSTRR